METTFSIIMPVFNVEKYLEESIESILNQTFTSFELLIINDGSTDKSRLIAEKFSVKDHRVKIFDKENGGASSARNIGLEHAVGEYIYFMDSDDQLEKDALQTIKNLFSEHNTDMIMFTAKPFFDKEYASKTDEILEVSENYYGRSFLQGGDYSAKEYYELTARENKFVASVCLFATKRKLIKEAGLHFFEGIMFEDELFTRKLLFTANKIHFVKANLYKRRIRSGSVSTSGNDIYKANSLLTIAEKLHGLNELYNDIQLAKYVEYFYNLTIKSLLLIDENSSEYNLVIRKLFTSPLSVFFRLPFKTKVLLKYKQLKLSERRPFFFQKGFPQK